MDYRSELYNTYITTHFGHIRDISARALRRHQRFFRHYYGRFLPQDRNARILEVGCGYGSFLHYLKAEGYVNAEGVDVSPEQVKAAHELGLSNVYCADVLSFLPQRAGSYDCVVAIDFLDHFPKSQVLDVLKAIRDSLRPGGCLILQAVNGDGPFAGRLRYGDFTHEFALTSTSAQQIMKASGFDRVSICGTDPFVHGFPSLIRVIVWKVIKACLLVYLIAETASMRGHVLTQNLIAVAYKPVEGSGNGA